MRASARRALLLAATLGAACVTRTRRLAPSGTATAAGMPDAIQEMAQAVLLDAKGDRAADTLYASEALVVANARVRLGTPRFAGVGLGGRATVAAAGVNLGGRVARGVVGCRWGAA